MKSQSEVHSCALRALTLCDGQVLEDPDRHPAECLCARLRRAEDHLTPRVQRQVRQERQELIERTMAAPELPLL